MNRIITGERQDAATSANAVVRTFHETHPAPESAEVWPYLIPSVRNVIFIFIFWSLLAGTLSNRPLSDPDIGWHIRTGELILAQHALPRTDPFSATMHGQTWFAWEWLYDIALGILYRACGLNGVAWLCALLVAATLTLLLSQMVRRGTGLLLAILLMLLAELVVTIHLFARPHIVSWLLTLIWFGALERWEQGALPRWLRWFFPASILLWVNLHGGWLFAFALFAVYLAAAIIESLRAADPFAALAAGRRARDMAWTGGASALATLANPFGWRLHVHIYRYLSDRYLMNRISEFRSPDFHGWPARCFVIILLLTLMAFAGQRRTIRLSHLLVTLLAVYSGFLSSRNLPVSAMVMVLIMGPLLWKSIGAVANRPGASRGLRALLARCIEFSGRMGQQEMSTRGQIWPSIAVIAALAVCLNGGKLGSRHVIDAHFDATKLPVAAADFLQRQSEGSPVFSTDSWGSYLIYRLYPSRLVIIDDRHDLYGSARVRDMLVLTQGEPGWRNVLENWHIQTVLLPKGSTLANLLLELPQDWSKTYGDEVAVVYQKR